MKFSVSLIGDQPGTYAGMAAQVCTADALGCIAPGSVSGTSPNGDSLERDRARVAHATSRLPGEVRNSDAVSDLAYPPREVIES